MNKQYLFDFKTELMHVHIPDKLNNPFGHVIPEIAQIAAEEFQNYITSEAEVWTYDFRLQKGKMFGVLVVQNEDYSYSYLGTVSGKLGRKTTNDRFIPSVFDDSTDDFFINKGMTELTEMSALIKQTNDPSEVSKFKEKRKLKSLALQQRLFEHTQFLNMIGVEKNVLQIFEDSSHGNPPSAAGECAAPKLLQYAFKHGLRPIAIAEFWWGNAPKNKERDHKMFYPACKNKCRPILEYMLDDAELFSNSSK